MLPSTAFLIVTIFLSGVILSSCFRSVPYTFSFVQFRAQSRCPTAQLINHLSAKEEEEYDDDSSQAQGYRFGDITKGFLKRATHAINDITGKDEYKFGDLSRHVDSNIKQQINDITGQGEYRLGDLTRHVDARAKAMIGNYTGKDEYSVGDISKEIVRRVSSGEYKVEDVVLLCKVLLSFGAGLTPIANFLPVKLLIEMIEFGLAQEVGERVLGALATTLDERFKETITGDPNYRIGDKTKQAIMNLMTMAAESSKRSRKTTVSLEKESEMDTALIAELEDWDRRLGIAIDSDNNKKKTT